MTRIIHRIWLGGAMPQKFRDYGQQWSELNPAWELMDWTEEVVMDTAWENRSVISDMLRKSKQPGADKIAFYTQVADVVDYELVYKFGGLYLNTDVKPIRPLTNLFMDNESAHLAMEDDVHAVNMAMYSNRPLNGFFEKAIEILPSRYFGMPGQGMHITTGPGLIQNALTQYRGPVVKWHKDIWNPIHWSEIPVGEVPDLDRQYPASTVAVHSWSHKEFKRGHEILEN